MTPPQLRPYQQEAVEFIHNRRRAGLLLDMGLGKTCISLSALQPRHLPVLVCAPKRVAEEVWDVEVAKWRPDLTVAVAAGSPAKRKAALESGADIVVIGRDNLADAVRVAGRYKSFIIDELSGFKTRSSVRWKLARKISLHPNMDNVWGLTGTPSPNGLLDMWAPMFLLDQGESLGTTLGGYRERYFTEGRRLPTGIVTEWHIRPGAADRIHTLLERTCLAMATEGRVDLPPVNVNLVDVALPPAVRLLYKTMKNDSVINLELLGGEIHSAVNAATLSNKLSQIAAGFIYVDDADLRDGAYKILHKEKTKAVQEIVEGTGSPVLVFYRYKAELDMLREAMPWAHTMDSPGVVKRWNRGEIRVLLAHPASAGHGLNLQDGGHTLVWTSLTWSLEEFQQANKRLARSGQKNPVVIHILQAHHTIDPAILARLEGKETIQSALLKHLESPL